MFPLSVYAEGIFALSSCGLAFRSERALRTGPFKASAIYQRRAVKHHDPDHEFTDDEINQADGGCNRQRLRPNRRCNVACSACLAGVLAFITLFAVAAG